MPTELGVFSLVFFRALEEYLWEQWVGEFPAGGPGGMALAGVVDT
jgi:hypothetical protein